MSEFIEVGVEVEQEFASSERTQRRRPDAFYDSPFVRSHSTIMLSG